MKEISDLVDPRIMFKHQALLQDYHQLQKETEYKMRKLEMMKQKRSSLDAQVRFLRRRYKHLKQDQTLETSSGKRKKKSGPRVSMPCFDFKHKDPVCDDNASCDLEKNQKRSRGNVVLRIDSTPLPDLNDNTLVINKVSGFDLNQISREEEEREANGEAAKKVMLGNGIDCEMNLPICRDVEKEISRAVKRKVSWQDPVALRV